MMDPLSIKEVFFNKKVLKTPKMEHSGKRKIFKTAAEFRKKAKGYQLVSLLWQALTLLFVC